MPFSFIVAPRTSQFDLWFTMFTRLEGVRDDYVLNGQEGLFLQAKGRLLTFLNEGVTVFAVHGDRLVFQVFLEEEQYQVEVFRDLEGNLCSSTKNDSQELCEKLSERVFSVRVVDTFICPLYAAFSVVLKCGNALSVTEYDSVLGKLTRFLPQEITLLGSTPSSLLFCFHDCLIVARLNTQEKLFLHPFDEGVIPETVLQALHFRLTRYFLFFSLHTILPV